jgi:hypothetical protein
VRWVGIPARGRDDLPAPPIQKTLVAEKARTGNSASYFPAQKSIVVEIERWPEGVEVGRLGSSTERELGQG